MELTISYLKKQFNKYNNEFFGGVLPEINIEISRTKKALGQFTYLTKTKKPLKIRISKYYNRSAFDIDQTLVHEMIHYYICFMGLPDNGSHGVQFMSIAKEINSKSDFNITATTFNMAPMSVKKSYRIMCFTYNGRRCYSRICKTFNYKWFVNKYKFEDVSIVKTTLAGFDDWVECRSRLRWYYENTLTKKLLQSA